MATIKTQNGKVITKDGKVSCECCSTCQIPDDLPHPIVITKQQYDALGRGGTGFFSFTAIPNSDAPEYTETQTLAVAFDPCSFYGPRIFCSPPPRNCVGNVSVLNRGIRNQEYLFTLSVFSFGGYSGPSFYLTKPGFGRASYVTSSTLSVVLDGVNIPCEFYFSVDGIGVSYTVDCQFTYVSNP